MQAPCPVLGVASAPDHPPVRTGQLEPSSCIGFWHAQFQNRHPDRYRMGSSVPAGGGSGCSFWSLHSLGGVKHRIRPTGPNNKPCTLFTITSLVARLVQNSDAQPKTIGKGELSDLLLSFAKSERELRFQHPRSDPLIPHNTPHCLSPFAQVGFCDTSPDERLCERCCHFSSTFRWNLGQLPLPTEHTFPHPPTQPYSPDNLHVSVARQKAGGSCVPT